MKKLLLSCLPLILLLAVMLSSVSCTIYSIDSATGKADIYAFLSAIEQEDYVTAEGYLHPDYQVDLTEKMAEVPVEYRTNFGITPEGSALYVYEYTDITGAVYGRAYDFRVGDKVVDIYVELLLNDNGYGVYDFVIDPLE